MAVVPAVIDFVLVFDSRFRPQKCAVTHRADRLVGFRKIGAISEESVMLVRIAHVYFFSVLFTGSGSRVLSAA